jgi:Tfp pilus assembly protein PilN
VIRANLSTRPFYNERAVQLWLLVLALIVVAATVFNVARVIRYSRIDTDLVTQSPREEARAAELRAEAARLRGSVDLKEIELASTEARQANALIDRRTFSWTDLLNQFETTFPDNVRVTAVKPDIDDKGGLGLTINVVARSVNDVDQLIGNLEATGNFTNPHSVTEHFNADGNLEAVLNADYVLRREKPAAPEAKRP